MIWYQLISMMSLEVKKKAIQTIKNNKIKAKIKMKNIKYRNKIGICLLEEINK